MQKKNSIPSILYRQLCRSAAVPLWVLAFQLLLASCSHTRILQASLRDTLPPLPESSIHIPVKLVAKPFLDKAELLAPPEFTSTRWPDYTVYGCDFRYKYRFLRAALRFACTGNQVTISATGNYQVAGSRSACLMGKQVAPWINGSCGFGNEPLRRVDITVRTTLRFLPDYTLRSRSVIDTIHPVDKCSVTLLNTDITGMVMTTVRSSMEAFAASLDHDIAALNLGPLMRKVETSLGRKINLGPYGYLSVNPSSVKMGGINLTGDTIYLTAGLACFPELRPDSAGAVVPKLPRLVNTDLPPGFTLYANAGYDYPFLSGLLTKAVQNRLFTIRGEEIRIEALDLRGTGNRQVEIKVTFTGSRKGVLYVTGTPVLDLRNQLVSMPDLAFSLQSKSFVLNAGKAFFSKQILRSLRSLAVIDIGNLYRQHKQELDQVLTRTLAPDVFSTGSSTRVSLNGLVAAKDRLLFQAGLQGTISITVKKK